MATIFPCTRCGLCCRDVGASVHTQWLDRGDGCCRHFDGTTRLCTIYAERPAVCRIDDGYQSFAKEFTLLAFHKANADACNAQQLRHRSPPGERVMIYDANYAPTYESPEGC